MAALSLPRTLMSGDAIGTQAVKCFCKKKFRKPLNNNFAFLYSRCIILFLAILCSF
jgi:hypothetical protein